MQRYGAGVSFRTLAAPFDFADEPVKGSRFVALAAPAADEAAARALIDEARRRWPDASHHTYAWRLRGGGQRAFDAGEPRGSAGPPILAMIDGHGLVDVVVVVARWFGGTQLGVGGLMRAYGACAGRALDRAEVVEVIPTVDLELRYGWGDVGAVQALVAQRGLHVVDTRYEADVVVVIRVPEPEVDGFRAALRDRTAGRVG